MELKLCYYSLTKKTRSLLIVPYGIETMHMNAQQAESISLLIVPYGIETLKLPKKMRRQQYF